MKNTADFIIYWFADNILPWILIGLILLLLAMLAIGARELLRDYKYRKLNGEIEHGIVIDKFYEKSRWVGVAGKGGHYIPESWNVVIGGRFSISQEIGVITLEVPEERFRRTNMGDKFTANK